MAINLEQYGIHASEIVYNPSYEMLFEEEMKPELTGYDKGQLTELDAVNVMTGIFTGRSPKDKYIVHQQDIGIHRKCSCERKALAHAT